MQARLAKAEVDGLRATRAFEARLANAVETEVPINAKSVAHVARMASALVDSFLAKYSFETIVTVTSKFVVAYVYASSTVYCTWAAVARRVFYLTMQGRFINESQTLHFSLIGAI